MTTIEAENPEDDPNLVAILPRSEYDKAIRFLNRVAIYPGIPLAGILWSSYPDVAKLSWSWDDDVLLMKMRELAIGKHEYCTIRLHPRDPRLYVFHMEYGIANYLLWEEGKLDKDYLFGVDLKSDGGFKIAFGDFIETNGFEIWGSTRTIEVDFNKPPSGLVGADPD